MPTNKEDPNEEEAPPQNDKDDPLADSESEPEPDSDPDSNSDSDSDTESGTTSKKKKEKKEGEEEDYYLRAGDYENIEDDNSAETNIKLFTRALHSRRNQRALEEEERGIETFEDEFDFPKDRENWQEADLKELWADAPYAATKPGWDPVWADEEDWDLVEDEIMDGDDPPIAPFYIPYRKPFPAIPTNHRDISTPKAVIEELDRIEEFLRWISYIFPDGSSYEGTVWDDLAHGKGVYVAEQGLVRYEGEWLQNNMEGHGVVEVDIPDIEPIPGSKLEAEMREDGEIIKRDYMTPEDREWLEMDIEDSLELADGRYVTPWYENDEWIKQFGKKPEKGRYRYAGQWKHSRMHGCGVYEVNEKTIYGRFYFGELVDDSAGCDEETCALHAGIAEVAAAKARMFINKPDGMVREQRGPYGDPQHPYFYEDEDVWQAPGFINQFYEVPDYWKTYVHEVDQEREMWLNSFYKAPLRLPMPAELEYWWQNENEEPEFVLLNKEPEPDPDDPSKLIDEDPVILHTPTGRVINYIEDEEHGVRLFWQPPMEEGEDVDPEKAVFLPLGFDEFYGREKVEKKENFLERLISSAEKTCKPLFEKLDKWTEEQKKDGEMRKKLLEQELEMVEAELCLEEAIEEMEEDLKQEEREAEKNAKIGSQEKEQDISVSPSLGNELPKEQKVSVQEDDEEEEEEDDDDLAPSSFGSVGDQASTKDKGNESGKSPFSTLSFASSGVLSTIPSVVERSFLVWKRAKSPPNRKLHSSSEEASTCLKSSDLVTFPIEYPKHMTLKMNHQAGRKFQVKKRPRKRVTASQISCLSSQSIYASDHQNVHQSPRINWLHSIPETNSERILSLQMPLQCLDLCSG